MSETIVLHTPGAIAGIPGESHAPGVYEVDWEARTITPVLSSAGQDVEAERNAAEIPVLPGEAEEVQPQEGEVKQEFPSPETIPQPEPLQEPAPSEEASAQPTPGEGV